MAPGTQRGGRRLRKPAAWVPLSSLNVIATQYILYSCRPAPAKSIESISSAWRRSSQIDDAGTSMRAHPHICTWIPLTLGSLLAVTVSLAITVAAG
ncbi:hypothetical protein BJY04DRAFT_188086 [Aspergillus karnatakaensis]|uniref:uncharacterized protein n=1 Tax=Aspergillus karnatakaensis TaxID=1810916 RepID=UPI003CCCD947